MKRALVLRRTAEAEYEAAIAEYEASREGLGSQFRAVIEHHF